MAISYVGYGFNVYDIPNKTLLGFMQKYSPDLFNRIVKNLKKKGILKETEEPTLEFLDDNVNADEYVRKTYKSLATYLKKVLNEQIRKDYHIKKRIVQAFDDFVAFENIYSPERKALVPSEEAFVDLILKYIDIDAFVNVWEHDDSSDPCYWTDAYWMD